MKYTLLAVIAWIRGLYYRYPNTGSSKMPMVITGLNGKDGARTMYYKHGWRPHIYHKTPYGISRSFIVDSDAGRGKRNTKMIDPREIFIGNQLNELITHLAEVIVKNNISTDQIQKCLPVMGALQNYGCDSYEILNRALNKRERHDQ